MPQGVTYRAQTPSFFDRLHLLPPEVRSIIYDFASEALTVHVRRKRRGRDEDSHLTVPRDARYPSPAPPCRNVFGKWSPFDERALFTALERTQDHGITNREQRPFAIMGEIIYELTGERRTRKDVSARQQFLRRRYLRPKRSQAGVRKALDDHFRATKRKVEKIQKDSKKLLQLPKTTSADVGPLLQSIQDTASQLPASIQAEREFSSLMDQPNPTLDGGVNIFRELSHLAADDANDIEARLAPPESGFFKCLTSVSRFYRIDALPNLASSITYEFGSDLGLLRSFSGLLSPGSRCHLKRVKINMVEGFMSEPRNLNDYLNATLPHLRFLDIDLWPRDPTRLDTGNRDWGEQSKVLVGSLHTGRAKVRLELRWVADCELFEREYVANGAWRRGWGDESEDPLYLKEAMCHRFYECGG